MNNYYDEIDEIDEKYEYDDKEWERIYGRFKNDFNRAKKYNKPFNELMIDIINDMKLDAKEFASRTTLNEMYFTRVQSPGYQPKMHNLITICMGLNFDMPMTLTLLEPLGRSFIKTNKVHYAYCRLITDYRGASIEKCNEILKRFGIDENDWLGSGNKRYKRYEK